MEVIETKRTVSGCKTSNSESKFAKALHLQSSRAGGTKSVENFLIVGEDNGKR